MNISFSQLLVATLLSTLLANKCLADVSIIVHPSDSSTASERDIRQVFLGRSTSLPGGQKVSPVNLPEGHPAREEFNEKVLKKSDGQLKAYWSGRIFTGKGLPPKELASDENIIHVVSSFPGCIGYISTESVTDAVKVLISF